VIAVDVRLTFEESILGAADHSKVRKSALGEADGDLHLLEAIVVGGVLHVFHNDAFLHLPDVLFLDHLHQVGESRVDEVGVEAV